MQTLFISPTDIQSTRWREAFPSALVLSAEHELPADLSDFLIWVVLGEQFHVAHVIKWVAAGARVVVLTATEDSGHAKQALEVGASGYLHYLAVVPVLQQVAQVVAIGGLWLGADLMRQLVFSTVKILNPVAFEPASHKLHLDLLSNREQAVAKAVVAGKSNKEVARALDITERTVKAHLSAVFEKLNVRDRLHLVLALSGHQ